MRTLQATTLLVGAALLFSAGAIAGEPNKSTLQLSDKVTVEGKALNSGKYTVEWDGTGPNVHVTLLQGKQTVATFPAHLTEQAAPNAQGAYSTTAEPDGSRALSAIYPGGKRLSLTIDQNQASQ
jgi:hypothetical protein